MVEPRCFVRKHGTGLFGSSLFDLFGEGRFRPLPYAGHSSCHQGSTLFHVMVLVWLRVGGSVLAVGRESVTADEALSGVFAKSVVTSVRFVICLGLRTGSPCPWSEPARLLS